MDSRRFALVLDSYPSHQDPEVATLANEIHIELIFVPRGGTGEFQPLYRRIFGVVKARNKKDQKTAEVPKELVRYSYIHEQTKKNFDTISNYCIESAWSIPYLEQYLPSSSSEDDESSEFFDESDE